MRVQSKMQKIFSLIGVGSLLASSVATAQPSCSLETIAGAYRLQQPNRVGELWLFKDGTYKTYNLEVAGNVIKRIPAEKGTFKFIWGCAAQFHINETPEEQVWPVYFSSIKVIDGKKVPNSAVWMNGSMERILSK